ncbi:PREDICTED: alpha-protein kinase 2 [Condylura cristata]|uniref:alpha-protein kinase 2 n=1 Tax=Condylura cristata TaxID=143302 RepID=UPI0003344955|nr:PREDICTED: alpha-protein kinase 2 [Condylura cristata]
MADSGGSPRCALCFLSTPLSQKVPEKSDTTLRCVISGQPKPEVTWYKDGQTIEGSDIISSYEFFENQYIHMLHLYGCTPKDAAVYQVSAKNCFGMICSSASIEIEGFSQKPQCCSTLKGDGDTGHLHATETHEQENTNQTDGKEQPYKEEESASLGTALSADSPSSRCEGLCSGGSLASSDITVPSAENPLGGGGRRRAEEASQPNTSEETADGLLCPSSSNSSHEQEACGPRNVGSQGSRSKEGALRADGLAGAAVNACPPHATAQKYIGISLPLWGAAGASPTGGWARSHTPGGPQTSSEDSDSDYELCPEITLTYTEEFSDDDLEYLECSDVMTDYANALWQKDLQGTQCVFLLESDDEDMESGECCLGGCEHSLREMGCGSRVSGDTRRMEATTGFCHHHSQPHGVGVRRAPASTHSPSSPQTEMTLTLEPPQDGTATVTDRETYKLPTAPEAVENGYPGIQGETRDSHPAGEEFACDNLLNVEEAVRGREMRRSSGQSEQAAGGAAQTRIGGKDLPSRRGSEKTTSVRRPGMKGKPKKLKNSAAEGSPNLLYPKGPVKHTQAPSDPRESPHTRAEATDLNSQVPAGGFAISTQAEQEATHLQTPSDSCPQDGDFSYLEGEGGQVNNLFETSQVPDESDHPQVQTQDTVAETISLSQRPASCEPAWRQSTGAGTTADSFSTLGGIDEENAPLAQLLEPQHCAQGTQHEGQEREDDTPGYSWGDLGHELSVPEAEDTDMSPCELPMCSPQGGSTDLGDPEDLSGASLEPTNSTSTLRTVCPGLAGGEGMFAMEHLEAGDQGAGGAPGSPVAPESEYLPQEIFSMDFELEETQSHVSDLWYPDDETLGDTFQTGASEAPLAANESSTGGDSAVSPLSPPTFTKNTSPEASEGASQIENFPSVLASRVQTGQEGLCPSLVEAHDGGWPLTPEDRSSVLFEEGGDRSPCTSDPDTADSPTSQSATEVIPREMPAAVTADLECVLVTRESRNTSTVTIATKVPQAKSLPLSITWDSHADGPEDPACQGAGEDGSQPPPGMQLEPILNDSTPESTEEQTCMAAMGPGAYILAPQLLEEEPSLQDKSQAVDGADSRSLEENFQEKGCETTQAVPQEGLPHEGSLSEDDLWESVPMTSAALEEGSLEPMPAGPREDSGQSSGLGTSVSAGAEATTEDDCQVLSTIPLLSNILLEEAKEIRPEDWGAGSKLKIITLEATISEIWSPREWADSESQESEAGLRTPDGPWAVADVPQTEAASPEPDPSETAARAHSPEPEPGSASADDTDLVLEDEDREPGSALAEDSDLVQEDEDHEDREPGSAHEDEDREPGSALAEDADLVLEDEDREPGSASADNTDLVLEDEDPASSAQWSAPSCPCLSPLRVLESSVDPVNEKELAVTDLLSEVSKIGRQEPVSSVSPNQEQNQPKEDHPAFFKQFLACPEILESSVDPVTETGEEEWARAETPEPSVHSLGLSREESEPNDANLGQRVEVQPTTLQVLCPQQSGGATPCANSTNWNQEDSEQGQQDRANTEVQPATVQVVCPWEEGVTVWGRCNSGQIQVGFGEAEQSDNRPGPISPTVPLSMTRSSAAVDTRNSTGQLLRDSEEPTSHPCAFSHPKEGGTLEKECGEHPPTSGGLTQPPFTSSLERNNTDFSVSHKIGEPQVGEAQVGKAKPTLPPVTGLDAVRKRPGSSGSGHLAEGIKKKILSRVAALRLRLEEKENARKNTSFIKKTPKRETSGPHTDEKKEKRDLKKPPCQRAGKAPVLLKKIQAEMFPDHPGNIKLSCQFAEIHEDSTIWWTRDSKSLSQVQRSAGDNSTVSLAIVEASQKDQGLYYCCIKNSYGKVTAEFNLTAEVLRQLSSHQDTKGCEEIEFSQLIFKEDFLSDSYFGDRLRGQIATEALHFGEGVHRKAFRSRVMQGLLPVFQPGHPCVLKVHNAVAYGTRNNDELIQRNYKLAAQECYVQNTARYYAQIYAAEAQPLEGFGEVPEIIPIFLIHRPENNIPYATVEEELMGEFVKYSMRDGKEINFLRRESEAGQKCCTFQHWVYQKTSGCLLVTDMQGVGMKLTDVGIATLAKGYKGFKGNCSMTFIDQFKALHQCNKYCKMLGLKSLQSTSQKLKKPSVGKSKIQPSSTAVKKVASGTPAEKNT